MKTVALINPRTVNKYYHVASGFFDRCLARFIRRHYDGRFAMHGRCATMPPITLLALRALFEERGCRTVLIDEQVDEIDFGLDVDLICLTASTPQIERARRIASAFRARGIPAAVGGVHASCLPEECTAHFDTVCVGEAEGYIDELVRDLRGGRLKPLYRNEREIDLDETPFYSYDVASGKHMPFYAINFSRGCNFRCEFCSVQSTLGRHRTRSVKSVVRAIAESGAREIWFSDASLTADRGKARALFRALVPLKINWLSSVPLNIAGDEELLDLMAESGCWLVSVGFESLNGDNLRASGKAQNRVEEYRRVIRALHKRRIAVEGNFVFGFDGDVADAFDTTAAFTIDAGIDIPEFYVLTPYPGTPLYRRLLGEERIRDRDWTHYDNTHFQYLPVFEPKRMDREALREGCRRAEQTAYRPWNCIRRLRNAGIYRPSVWLANAIFSRRMVQQRNLIPRGEEYSLDAEFLPGSPAQVVS